MSLSVAGVLGESARHFPDRIAVVEGGTRLTYAELWTEALRCAAGLRDAGVKPGDRLAVLLPNTIEFLKVYYGALAAGATVLLFCWFWVTFSLSQANWPCDTGPLNTGPL